MDGADFFLITIFNFVETFLCVFPILMQTLVVPLVAAQKFRDRNLFGFPLPAALLFVGSDDEQDCNGDRYPRIVNLILTNLDLKLALCFSSMNLFGLMDNFKNALIVRVYFLFCEACSGILMALITGQFEFYTHKEGLVLSSGTQDKVKI